MLPPLPYNLFPNCHSERQRLEESQQIAFPLDSNNRKAGDNVLKYTDVHSHILHRLDDGPEHIETSLKMLEEEYRQNVETVILTPHFKDAEHASIDDFLRKRNERAEELKRFAGEQGVTIPELRLGAEVALNCDLSVIDGIEKLCIEGTRYILIEMPYSAWYDWMFDSLYSLVAHCNLIPVIAHIERYPHVDKKKLNKLSGMDVYFQINAEAVLDKKMRKNVIKMIEKDAIHLMGSDCHNQSGRAPNLADGYEYLVKKVSGEFAHYLNVNSHLLLDNEYIEKYSGNYYQVETESFFRRIFR